MIDGCYDAWENPCAETSNVDRIEWYAISRHYENLDFYLFLRDSLSLLLPVMRFRTGKRSIAASGIIDIRKSRSQTSLSLLVSITRPPD